MTKSTKAMSKPARRNNKGSSITASGTEAATTASDKEASESKAQTQTAASGQTDDKPSPTPSSFSASSNPAPPRPHTRIARVIALLSREGGATLNELTEATGWQTHSVRAALTGIKKKGYAITRFRRDDVSCYRIEGEG